MSAAGRLVLLTTSPRVVPGLLSWAAWRVLQEARVYTGDLAHPQLPALSEAGVTVEVLAPEEGEAGLARTLRALAGGAGTTVWLAGPDGDPELARALAELARSKAADGGSVELEVVSGSSDLPGAHLLDVVATMDRLRSPGGCPWDAERTHDDLAPYLLEEAYEAVDAIERADLSGLRDELGDVLLQVVFHSRLAQERTDDSGWDIDDVAAGLVEKLVRRHPHVFGGREVSGVADVVASWDTIKAAEGRRTSVVDGVALGAPALSVAAKLQDRAASIGLPPSLLADELAVAETLPQAVAGAAAALVDPATAPVEEVGDLLFAAVALARFHGVDPEAALRGTARRFRDRLDAAQRAAADSVTGRSAPGREPSWPPVLSEELAEPSDDELLASEDGPTSH